MHMKKNTNAQRAEVQAAAGGKSRGAGLDRLFSPAMAKTKSKASGSQRKASPPVSKKKAKRTEKASRNEQLVGKILFIQKTKQGNKFILNASTTGGRLQVYVSQSFVPQTGGTCSPDLLYVIPFTRYKEDKLVDELDIQGYVTAELICQGTCERMLAMMADVT